MHIPTARSCTWKEMEAEFKVAFWGSVSFYPLLFGLLWLCGKWPT